MKKTMQNSIYHIVEVVGTSSTSFEDAAHSALDSTAGHDGEPKWFEVVSTRGKIDGGKVSEWQVVLKVGAKIE